MENINQYPNAILDLLKQKDFSALNAEEKTIIKAFLDEDIYAKLRETYSAINTAEKSFAADIKVRPQTKTALLNAVNRKKKPVFWLGLVDYKIPAWQAVAAVLLVMFTFFLLQNTSEGNASKNLVTITDTVKVMKQEVEKILVYDTVFMSGKSVKPKKTKSTGIILLDHENASENNSTQAINLGGLSVLSLEGREQMQPSGNSLSDDTLVNKFNFVTIN